jgi:hypothetical protein
MTSNLRHKKQNPKGKEIFYFADKMIRPKHPYFLATTIFL